MPPAQRTHYEVLGIAVTATTIEIRRAYRSLAKVHHPDVGGSGASDSNFAVIAQAYEVLSDRRQRAEYDRSLEQPPHGGATATVAHYSWDNIAARRPSNKPRVSSSELDELYDTFFGERRR